jgi:hypothetical protein
MNTEELIAAMGGASLEWRWYSGRSMYGNECVAIEIDTLRDLFTIGQSLPGADKPDVDALGKGYIAYWPHCLKAVS